MQDRNGVEVKFRDRVRIIADGKGLQPTDLGQVFVVHGFNSRRHRTFLVRADVPRGSTERLTRHADPSTFAILRRDGEDGYERPDDRPRATSRQLLRESHAEHVAANRSLGATGGAS